MQMYLETFWVQTLPERARNLRPSSQQQDDKSSDLPRAARLPGKLKLHVPKEWEDLGCCKLEHQRGSFLP